jgi:RNA 3'-terminal phosphate cyclase (ATP)
MLVLDGSYGEGGGQILRTALSLAALTNTAVRLLNIRTGRTKPGLRPQHLTAVQSLARITRAELVGDTIGSTSLTFSPRGIYPGRFTFDVAEKTGSAGAVSLVAQTLLPVLLFAQAPSTLILKGGTHVPMSPPAHYLTAVFLPALSEMGVHADLTITKWGFYPQGGGEIVLQVQPVRLLTPVAWTAPPQAETFRGLSAAANLPEHVRQRQSRSVHQHLGWPLPIREEDAPSPGRGSFVFLWGSHAGFGALGARGKPAEQVGTEAAQALKIFLASGAGADGHLADQIALYTALAQGRSTLTTAMITSHLLTNMWVIEQFLPVRFDIVGLLDEKGSISLAGSAFRPPV